mmetsp:Transcript_32817/g.60479  ORF Transcript_32817/g.60479 Transcript_32817/m.60479 type:complete len:234 (+) Transcript_32817:32-733(+)
MYGVYRLILSYSNHPRKLIRYCTTPFESTISLDLKSSILRSSSLQLLNIILQHRIIISLPTRTQIRLHHRLVHATHHRIQFTNRLIQLGREKQPHQIRHLQIRRQRINAIIQRQHPQPQTTHQEQVHQQSQSQILKSEKDGCPCDIRGVVKQPNPRRQIGQWRSGLDDPRQRISHQSVQQRPRGCECEIGRRPRRQGDALVPFLRFRNDRRVGDASDVVRYGVDGPVWNCYCG